MVPVGGWGTDNPEAGTVTAEGGEVGGAVSVPAAGYGGNGTGER